MCNVSVSRTCDCSLVPKKKEEEPGFSHLHMCLNRSGIPYTIDILSYTCDANIGTTRYTIHRFTIAAYGV